MRVFGALWAVPAMGFVIAGAALLANIGGWESFTLGAAALSLVLTALDLKAAFAGALLNLLIIAVLWAGLTAQLHRV